MWFSSLSKTFKVIAIVYFASLSPCSSNYINNENAITDEAVNAFPQIVFPFFNEVNNDFLEQGRSLIRGKTLELEGVLLFEAEDTFGTFIAAYVGSNFSHISVLLRNAHNHEEKFSFEETWDYSDMVRGVIPQAQLHLLSDVVQNCATRLVKREFIFEQAPNSTDITTFVHQYLGTIYKTSIDQLLKFPARRNIKADNTTLFCSELAALMLQELGYLSCNVCANNFSPKDFCEKDECLAFLNGAHLGPEVEILNPYTSQTSWCTVS